MAWENYLTAGKAENSTFSIHVLNYRLHLIYYTKQTRAAPQKHAWNAPFPVTFVPKMKARMYSCFHVMEATKHTCSTESTIGT